MMIILFASFLVSLISFCGALLLLWKKNFFVKFLPYLVNLAAGTMLTTAFIDLLPEAFGEIGEKKTVFAAALLGVIFFFFLERFVLWFHHHDDTHNMKPSAYLVLLGDSFHNFIDGVAIAASFLTAMPLGITTTLAIILHEIPHEIADYGVLIHGGFKPKKALFFNFLSALTSLLGAIAALFFLQYIQRALPLSLAFTGGMFIYIACSDLIPDLHNEFKRDKRWEQSLTFIIGIALAWFIIGFLEG